MCSTPQYGIARQRCLRISSSGPRIVRAHVTKADWSSIIRCTGFVLCCHNLHPRINPGAVPQLCSEIILIYAYNPQKVKTSISHSTSLLPASFVQVYSVQQKGQQAYKGKMEKHHGGHPMNQDICITISAVFLISSGATVRPPCVSLIESKV
ncbi:hypothetical protein M501DRAFT_490693 [Patellaria atrata CBS 101060]|uniref:Uncharacterized protein n=1 Tax=Patellaria atrata CBS 101060 TaxID=1346257 RepID=A0A9P4S4C1_9PEZI|nr:hypothetical protein M501DRAFT_490693 [Patellaria atrata CBS 101060]